MDLDLSPGNGEHLDPLDNAIAARAASRDILEEEREEVTTRLESVRPERTLYGEECFVYAGKDEEIEYLENRLERIDKMLA